MEEKLGEDIQEMKVTLYGEDRRSGVVADVNYLMTRSQLLNAIGGVLIGVLSSVITAAFIASVLG